MVAPLPTALVDQLTTAAQRILENSNKLHAVYLNNLQADTTTAQTGLLTASLLASPSASNSAISTIELQSSNFDDDAACQNLAELVDVARGLDRLNIDP